MHWSGALFSYANAGLTSAVRSKAGRGTLEPSLPPLSLTPSLSPCLSLSSHTHTHTLTHTRARSHTLSHRSLSHSLSLSPSLSCTPCVPVRSYSTTPCWILLTRLADSDAETRFSKRILPTLLRFDFFYYYYYFFLLRRVVYFVFVFLFFLFFSWFAAEGWELCVKVSPASAPPLHPVCAAAVRGSLCAQGDGG